MWWLFNGELEQLWQVMTLSKYEERQEFAWSGLGISVKT
jgi:hypothetical protein